jgi:hypothetical protein
MRWKLGYLGGFQHLLGVVRDVELDTYGTRIVVSTGSNHVHGHIYI